MAAEVTSAVIKWHKRWQRGSFSEREVESAGPSGPGKSVVILGCGWGVSGTTGDITEGRRTRGREGRSGKADLPDYAELKYKNC